MKAPLFCFACLGIKVIPISISLESAKACYILSISPCKLSIDGVSLAAADGAAAVGGVFIIDMIFACFRV